MACKGCGGADDHHKPGCGFSPTVLQITNKDCILFHNVTIPAIMGDETEVPPTNGLYKNVLLYYEASGNAYFYSSDGIPTKLTYATTDYNALTDKPTINGITLEGNQSSSSLGININDATLTIKQGDTTLGTFSANASENVEINLPASDSIRLTVAYGEGTWEDGNMPGLDLDPNNALAKGYISGRIIPSPTFTDESTGTVYTLEDVYNLLEDGKKITLDAVPLGWYIKDSSEPVVQLVDGVPIVSRVDGGRGSISYFGGAMCSCAKEYAAVTMFGIAIFRYIRSSDQSVVYEFVTQGAERITQLS